MPFNNPEFSKIMSKEEDQRFRLLRDTFINPFGEEKGGGPIAPFGLSEDGRPILNPLNPLTGLPFDPDRAGPPDIISPLISAQQSDLQALADAVKVFKPTSSAQLPTIPVQGSGIRPPESLTPQAVSQPGTFTTSPGFRPTPTPGIDPLARAYQENAALYNQPLGSVGDVVGRIRKLAGFKQGGIANFFKERVK